MFLTVDGTFIIQLINFAIFFALLNVLFLRPVGAAIKRRREYINGVQRDYERYAREAAQLRGDANARRAAARRAAEEAVTRARAEAEAQAHDIVTARTSDAHAIAETARQAVAAELAAAKEREEQLSRQLAQSLLARALGAAG